MECILPRRRCTMGMEDVVKDIAELIALEGNVQAVFGKPVDIDGRTVVPVARVNVRVGGGMGSGGNNHGKVVSRGTGGGGGLDVHVEPMGFLTAEGGHITFLPIEGASLAG